MKISLYWEDPTHPTILDVPDSECEIWVEDDYQRRLAEAAEEDKPNIERRTAQQIADEDYNRPTYSNEHTETRRCVSYEALDPEGKHIQGAGDPEEEFLKHEYPELYAALMKLLPRQRDLVKKVFFDEMSQREVAAEEGVRESAISERMTTIYARLRKILEKK